MSAQTEAELLLDRLTESTRQKRIALEEVRMRQGVALVTLLSGAPNLETLQANIKDVEALNASESGAKTALILALDMELLQAKKMLGQAVPS